MIGRLCRNFHWLASAFLLVAVIPLSHLARLPLRYDVWAIAGFARTIAVDAMIAGFFLYLIAYPRESMRRLSTRGKPVPFPTGLLLSIFLPMIYLVCGFLLVMTYNDIIASLRFDGSADGALARLDSSLLAGGSVLSWAHGFFYRFPRSLPLIEFLYGVLMPIFAACIAIAGIGGGLRRSMAFVGATLTAYYISLAVFYFVPAKGPYFLDRSLPWPVDSQVYILQTDYVKVLPLFHLGYRPARIGADYFLAVPCMHLVQPLIAMWYLRNQKGIVRVLAVYTVFLVPAILLLEEHYVVDLIGGVAVAILALAMMEGLPRRSEAPSS